METVKRVYEKPTILKVQLSHEQAVLSVCVVGAVNLSGNQTASCLSNCRRANMSGGDLNGRS